ncbi:H/ACA ribonucleoprotein complex subunit 2-like protein [Bolinopsis microptera]|uniref:H/ACA ribonucleoprotein complex subunit 2-like protein n=1 Tax=Bolinopsis microptera TaxID=2820187 RepID=UPI0030797DE7
MVSIIEEQAATETTSVDKMEISYEAKCALTIPIAKPLATRKLSKKLYKCCKIASKAKSIRRGTKEVGKSLRKGEKGFVIIAGDISPIDVISHFPVLCEESKVPYVYVPARADLGAAIGSNTPCSVLLIQKGEEYKDKYKECVKGIKELPNIYC